MNPFPLSLYIHLPWCEKRCPYCDFNVTTSIPDNFQAISKALISDLENSSDFIQNRKFASVYFGGGTPSLADPKVHENIVSWLINKKLLQDNIEITLECNPKETYLENLNRFKNIGINRFSLGIQSFDQEVLNGLGRNHSSKEAFNALDALQKVNARKTVDLIYGCPKQTLDKAMKDVEIVVNSNINHLSYYQLTIEPNTVFFSNTPKLPLEEDLSKLENACKQRLEAGFFKQYEVSSWSKNADYSVHNLNYWNYGDYLGIGPGSHSKISINKKSQRFTKFKKVSSYLKDQSPKLCQSIEGSAIDIDIAMNLFRLKNGPDLVKLKSYIKLSDDFMQKCKVAQKRGLLLKDSLVPSQRGFNFLNELIGLF